MKSEEQTQARQLYAQGLARSVIAEQIGVSRDAVTRWTADIPLPKKPCPVCNKAFRPKRTNKRYCSTKCSNKRDNKERKSTLAPKRECEQCGKTFQPRNDPRQLHCSKQCRDKVRNKLNYQKRKAQQSK